MPQITAIANQHQNTALPNNQTPVSGLFSRIKAAVIWVFQALGRMFWYLVTGRFLSEAGFYLFPGTSDKEALRLANQIITPDMGCSSRSLIAEKIASIPESHRERVIENVIQVIPPEASSDYRVAMIRQIAEIYHNHRGSAPIIDLVFQIIPRSMFDLVKSGALTHLLTSIIRNPMTTKETERLLKIVLQEFITQEMGEAARTKVTQVIPALLSITLNMNEQETKEIVQAVGRSPEYGSAPDVKRYADQLQIQITWRMKLPERLSMIRVVTLFQTIFKSSYYDYNEEKSFEEVISLPCNKREEVLQDALSLTTAEMNNGSKRDIIDMIIAAQPIIQGMSEVEKKPIFHAAIPIYCLNRNRYFEYTLKILTPDMDASSRLALFLEISALERFDLFNIVYHAREIFTPDMDASSRINILRAISVLKSNDRFDIVYRAREIFTPDMDASSRINILRALNNLKGSSTKAEFVLQYKKCIKSWKILGLKPAPSEQEIRKAYYNLSRQYHTDRNRKHPDETEEDYRARTVEKLQELNEARDFLTKKGEEIQLVL